MPHLTFWLNRNDDIHGVFLPFEYDFVIQPCEVSTVHTAEQSQALARCYIDQHAAAEHCVPVVVFFILSKVIPGVCCK